MSKERLEEIKEEYAYSHNAEEFYGYHESREEAIIEGSEYADDDQNYIYTGKIISPELGIDVDWTLERLSELAYDMSGGFSSDYGFLDGITKEEIAELETGLNIVLIDWLEKHRLVNFYTVSEVSMHRISDYLEGNSDE